MENRGSISKADNRFMDITQSYNRFIDMIHFTENISTRIQGLHSETEIFNAVKDAFAKSKDYSTVILKLDEAEQKLNIVAVSLPSKKIRAAEKVGKFNINNFSIKLEKSNILKRVIAEEETVHFTIKDLVSELFPKVIVELMWKTAGFQHKSGVVTPLKTHGRVMGGFSMTCPQFAKEFIPTAKNLAQHISYALELADEYAERKKVEIDLHKRFKEMNCLYGISKLFQKSSTLEEIIQGTVNLIIPSWQYPLSTCARITLGDQEFKTGNFRETIWKQTSDIKVYGKKQGAVEVYYLKEKPQKDEGPFLKEERSLLNVIAEELGRFIRERQVKEALKESESNLWQAQQLAKVGCWEWNLKDGVFNMYDHMRFIYGLKEEEFNNIEEVVEKLIHPDDRKYIQNAVEKVTTDGIGEPLTYRIIRPDGEIRWIAATPPEIKTYDGNNEPEVMFGVIQDITERERAKDKLREKEEHLRNLFETMVEGMIFINPDGQIVQANSAAERILGLKRSEIEARNYIAPEWEILRPDGTPMPSEEMAGPRAMKEKRPVMNIVMGVKHPDGNISWINASASPFVGKDGELTGVVGVFADITEHKLAEEKIRRIGDDYLSTTNLTGDIIVKVNLEGKWTFLNDAACKFWDKPRKELVGITFADYLHPRDYEETQAVVEKAIRKKAVKGLINRQMTPKGWRTVEWNGAPIYNKEGNYVGFQATGRDITERREAEKALKESELKYRTLFEGSADGIVIADVETKKLEYANNSLCKMLGYDKEEIKGKGVFDIHPKESLDHVVDEFMAQANGEKTLAEDIPCLKKDGTILYADINTLPLILNGRKYSVGFFRDITERKRTEEEKAVLVDQLRQGEKLRAIGELAGGIAHDFNNMLGAITGYADLIAEENLDENGNEKDAVLGKRINTITRASYRAADLIKKLLAFSRRGKFRNAPIDMHEIISDVLTLLEGSIDKKIILKRRLIATNAIIKGDPSQIQNAILNMAINACDAMKNGGVLLISTHNETLKKGQYCAELETGSYLVVSVSDTGKGMDEETKSRVFEPFFSTKGVGEGTGLGLASVYGTVKSHKGDVTVESRIGAGTRFRVYLPVINQEYMGGKIEDYRVIEKGHGTILVVDDEEMVRDMASDLLTKCGYTVYTCRDGSEAVAWYTEYNSNTDLVILDMIMPSMDGVDCYNKMKEINPEVKVILASGYSINGKVQKLLERGTLEFIEKPFSQVELANLVARKIKEKEDSRIRVNEKEQATS